MKVSRFIILIMLLTGSALSVFAQEGRDNESGGLAIAFDASEGDCDGNGIDDLDDFLPPDCIGDVKADVGSSTADTLVSDCNNNGIEDLDEFLPVDCYKAPTSDTGDSSAEFQPISDCDNNGVEDSIEYNPPPCIYDLTSDDGVNSVRPSTELQQKSQRGQ
ncbi:MAG: hypothetical protein ACPG7F_11565 [Aggregatilineales bacterium]